MIKKINFVKLFIALAILTSSFDIFLNLEIKGYSFRFTQFITIPIIIIYFFGGLKKQHIFLPIYGSYLLLFILIQSILLFRSPDISNGIKYFFWLIFSVLTLYAFSFASEKFFSFDWLIRLYLNSFYYIALFGILQFCAYPFGFKIFLTQNWSDKLARINGFCYEPSYYASYILMGFVIYTYLILHKENNVVSHMYFKTFIISLTLLLCSSRAGWIFAFLWVLKCILEYIFSLIKGTTRSKLIKNMVYTVFITIIIFLVLVFVIHNHKKLIFLLNGIGLFNTSSHSSESRFNGLIRSIEIWNDSPFLGYSLGGVAPMTCKYMGIKYTSDSNGITGGIFNQLLVGCGLIGSLPLVIYLHRIVFFKYKNVIMKALIWALIFEIGIMAFGQSILRPYLWIHIAIISCCYKHYNLKNDVREKI